MSAETDNYIVFSEPLEKLVTEIFIANGIQKHDATIVASNLIMANLRGVDSHGVTRVENYIKRVQMGGVTPNVSPIIVSETKSTILIDAQNGFGAVAAEFAARKVREKALTENIAFGTVRNSNHFGAAGAWAIQMAGNDMISFCASNVEPLMVSGGAKKPLIGNNPVCAVIPANKYGSICFDIATSTVAVGKIFEYRHKNRPLPDGWFVDENGENTNDPFLGLRVTAFGGHKGFGLAVVAETVTSILSSGAFGRRIGSMYGDLSNPNNLSHCFCAIKIDAFRDANEFRNDIDSLIDEMKAVPKKEGVNEIFFPGEIEQRNYAYNKEHGIKLPAALVEELIEISKNANLSQTSYGFLKDHPC